MNKTYFKSGGVVIGNTIAEEEESLYVLTEDVHTLTVGATRSGKTRCVVVPSICTIGLSGESLVVSDPKGELYLYTCDFLKKLEYEVMVIDYKNPEKSMKYNPLQPIINAINENNIDKAETFAWDITNILVGASTSGEKLWENGEKAILAAAILCVVADNKNKPEYQNLTNVYWFISKMSAAIENSDITPLQCYMDNLPDDHPAKALASIVEVAPERTRGSFYTSALTTLRLFTSRSISRITSESDFSFSNLGTKKQALFIILPDEKTTFYPLAALSVSQIYEILVNVADSRGGRLINRVNFILDEFGNFTKISDFDTKLTVGAGRGIRFNLFVQGFDQLVIKYGKDLASTIKGNCHYWVYLKSEDPDTLKEFSTKLGDYTTSAYQLSGQHGNYVNTSTSHSVSLLARSLLKADEIQRITRPYILVTGASHPAVMIAPDLSKYSYNIMCGLGSPEHNTKTREERQNARETFTGNYTVPLWGIWDVLKEMLIQKLSFENMSDMPQSVKDENFLKIIVSRAKDKWEDEPILKNMQLKLENKT